MVRPSAVPPSKLQGRGTLGPFLVDKNGFMYAIISGHIHSHMVRNDPIMISTRSKGKLEAFLYCQKDANDTYDISVVHISNNIKNVCKPLYRNLSRRVCSCSLYTGSADNLENQTVFLISEFSNKRQMIKGTVINFLCETNPGHFFVKPPFAKPGDSGGIVAMETAEDRIVLVGIICGESDKFCLCLLLHKGIEILNNRFKTEFTLLEEERSDHPEIQIIPGACFEFKMICPRNTSSRYIRNNAVKEKLKCLKWFSLEMKIILAIVVGIASLLFLSIYCMFQLPTTDEFVGYLD